MVVIDRFEGEFAVCECDGKMINIERKLVPDDAREGDVLELYDGRYFVNREETGKRKKRAGALFEDFKTGRGIKPR